MGTYKDKRKKHRPQKKGTEIIVKNNKSSDQV